MDKTSAATVVVRLTNGGLDPARAWLQSGNLKPLALSVFVGVAVLAYLLPEREVEQPDGVLVLHAPRQASIDSDPWQHKSYRFKPLATFTVRGRVLLLDRYRLGRESDVSPLDLTLGWGAMSSNAVLRQFTIYRGHRCYYWKPKTGEPPLTTNQVITHTANIHIIPANDGLAGQLKALHPGSLVELGGMLVDVTGADGWMWRSSVTRTDTGPGACEVMWVEWVRTG